MADLHKTLQTLGPVDWSDVPTDNLAPYLRDVFEAGELICNSVPPPSGGTDFTSAKPTKTSPDSASSAQEIVASSARFPSAPPDHADLQSSWGKPLKVNPNQLEMSVYKMAGKDRHGAWFARRSVHEGMSFTKMKKAMQYEFAESLAVKGGPGEGNVRGIGGDRKLEKKKVDGVGLLEVYQLSAQFPGPTTPREFITLLATSEHALTDKTSYEKDGKKQIPRHFMVVSKPVNHPEAPPRDGYIRGQYESVELIREVPIHSSAEDQELNPVEWIMVTRSDPGGGIPRFMVDRGTPSSICSDAVKFFNWACGKSEIPDPEHADEAAQESAAASNAQQPPTPAAAGAMVTPTQQHQQQPAHQSAQQQQEGIVSNLTNALEAGLETYAPTVASYTRSYLHPEDESDDSSDTSSFASAQEINSGHATPIQNPARQSMDSLNVSLASTPDTASTKGLPSQDKEILKIEEQREKLDRKIAKKRESENEKMETVKQKDDADQAKVLEKHEKELRKIEERRQKEVAKLEAKKEKELQKAEKKRRKNADRETVSRLSRERDDFRSQLDIFRRDNDLLKEQVGELQRENGILVKRLSEVGGPEAVKAIQEDFEADRKRSGSINKR